MNYCAHNGDPLKEHLRLTGELAEKILMEQGVRDPALLRVAKITGMSHDVGKYTEHFQTKLDGGKVRKELTYHSPLSAAYCAWAVKKLIGSDDFALIGFLSVYSHHGPIETREYRQRVKNFEPPFDYVVSSQAGSLERNAGEIDRELAEIGMPPISEFISDLKKGRVYEIAAPLLSNAALRKSTELYFELQMIFSALIDADKLVSNGISKIERKELPGNPFDKKVPDQDADERVLRMREETYRTVMENMKRYLRQEEIPRIFTIRAPTGAGKTRAALSAAVELREEIKKRHGYAPRIIYCLPYINITDQVYEYVVERVGEDLVLRHHARSLVHDRGDENTPLSRTLLLTESWDSEIVVSTFVQLFETLIGNSNHMLLKFSKITGSIVILDEVQAINSKFWPLIRFIVEKLANYSYILVMSATLPQLIVPDGSCVELARGLHFELDRVVLDFVGEKSVDELVEFACSKFPGCGSLAVILNTIPESIYVYRKVKERLTQVYGGRVKHVLEEGSPDDIFVAYLSTNLVPADREKILDRTKSLLESKMKVVLVCTQVIEAGVHIDFRVVVRDLAPFDSIVQSAGRCNRNGKGEGEVYVVEVRYGGENTYEKVYGDVAVLATKELLSGKIRESQFDELSQRYYEKLAWRKALERNSYCDEKIEAMERLRMENLATFHVVEEDKKVSVLIEKDGAKEQREKLEKKMKELEEARKKRDLKRIMELNAEITVVRRELEQYVVDLYEERIPPLKSLFEDMKRVPAEKYYDSETGFLFRSQPL